MFVFSSVKNVIYLTILLLLISGCGDESSSSNGGNSGVSGSNAQIIIFDGAVYSLASNKLIRVDISNPEEARVTDEVDFDFFDAETLTTDGDALYIGSPSEVRIYRYENENLEFVDSAVRQIRGKDPVVTDGEFAYSTVITRERQDLDENWSGRGDLYVYSVDDAKNITELAFYPNIGYVHGLALWQKNLLVCDPNDGLIQFDVTDPMLVERQRQYNFVTCKDILHVGDGHFITVGDQGVFQIMPFMSDKFAVISLFN